MSSKSKSYINRFLLLTILVITIITYVTIDNWSIEISQEQYKDVNNSIENCIELIPWLNDAVNNDDILSIAEYNWFKEHCDKVHKSNASKIWIDENTY